MRHRVEEYEVLSVPVPKDTETYRAVPNAQIINMVKGHTQKLGFEISETCYRMNQGGNQMSGIYKLKTPDDEMSMMLGFYNSYNKTRRFGIGTGALVNICYNGMIMAEYTLMRKHTGRINELLEEMILNAITSVTSEFDRAQKEKKRFIEQPIESLDQVHELVGELYLTEQILAANQLSALRKSIQDPENYFRILDNNKLIPGKSMWDMYNLVTESFKNEPAIDFVDKHVDFHLFMENKFSHEPNSATTAEPVLEVL